MVANMAVDSINNTVRGNSEMRTNKMPTSIVLGLALAVTAGFLFGGFLVLSMTVMSGKPIKWSMTEQTIRSVRDDGAPNEITPEMAEKNYFIKIDKAGKRFAVRLLDNGSAVIEGDLPAREAFMAWWKALSAERLSCTPAKTQDI